MGTDDFRRFETELGLVLEYIKYSKDREKLRGLVAGDARFTSVGAESALLINVLTDSRLEIDPGEEGVDMCKAIEDMRNEAMDEGRREGALKTLSELVRDGVLTLADAARRSGLSTEEFVARTALL